VLTGAMAQISGNYTASEDLLQFSNQSGITGSWNPVTGTLTLTGAATLAAYQAALRSITYANSSDAPSVLVRTVSFAATDGTDWSGNATRSVAVAAVNDPPVVTTSGGLAAYTENGAGVAVDPGLTISDVDSSSLAGATAQITANYAAAE